MAGCEGRPEAEGALGQRAGLGARLSSGSGSHVSTREGSPLCADLEAGHLVALGAVGVVAARVGGQRLAGPSVKIPAVPAGGAPGRGVAAAGAAGGALHGGRGRSAGCSKE